MNLYDLGKQVEGVLRYAPATPDWKADLYSTIDRQQRNVLTARSWPFMVRHVPLMLIPDMNVFVGVSRPPSPSRTLAIIGGITAGFGMIPEMQFGGIEGAAGALALQLMMASGCEVHLHDSYRAAMLADATANWSLAPFRIEGLPSVNIIRLEPTASFQTLPGIVAAPPLDHGQAVVTIKQPRVMLPPDVSEVLRIYDDDGVPLRGITREQAVRAGFQPGSRFDGTNRNQIGRPSWMVDDPGFEARLVEATDFQNQAQSMQVRDPRFTATASAGGTIPAGTWNVAICWSTVGSPPRYGPLTPPVQVTTTLANGTINLAALPVWNADSYGRSLTTFIQDANRPNAPYFIVSVRSDQTVATDSFAVITGMLTPEPSFGFRYGDVAGPYQYLRLLPRTDRLRRVLVEYLRRPPHLSDPGDEPLIPEEFQELLVWLAAEDLASRDDLQFRATCQAQAGRWRGALNAKFPGAKVIVQKGGVDNRDARVVPFINYTNIRYTP